jgi:predicted nucleic acid-binding protein
LIVVDANVLAYLYLPGDLTARAEALHQSDAEWQAPIQWRSEFRNILAGFMRRKALTLEQATEVQDKVEAFMSGNEHDVDSARVLELVRDSECSAYDCEYVALAMRLGVRLVTMDARLLKAFPGRAFPLP